MEDLLVELRIELTEYEARRAGQTTVVAHLSCDNRDAVVMGARIAKSDRGRWWDTARANHVNERQGSLWNTSTVAGGRSSRPPRCTEAPRAWAVRPLDRLRLVVQPWLTGAAYCAGLRWRHRC